MRAHRSVCARVLHDVADEADATLAAVVLSAVVLSAVALVDLRVQARGNDSRPGGPEAMTCGGRT